jgi:hypothetical protein
MSRFGGKATLAEHVTAHSDQIEPADEPPGIRPKPTLQQGSNDPDHSTADSRANIAAGATP